MLKWKGAFRLTVDTDSHAWPVLRVKGPVMTLLLVVALFTWPPARFACLPCAAIADELSSAAGRRHVSLFDQSPVTVQRPVPTVVLVDFGRVAFGNLVLKPPANATGMITVHFGEKLSEGRIDRQPPGSVRYGSVAVELVGDARLVVAPPADARNTEQVSRRHPPAILTPEEWGVVTPFRWVEIENWPGELQLDQIVRRAAFSKTWNDDAARFESSDETLSRIWELCRYSIKATTFAGIYVDGDRERIAYEPDTHLNQRSHYATDDNFQMARDTFDWLLQNGTWPTEAALHMPLIAHADWMHTGDRQWLAERYESLKTKLHADRVGDDGLIHSTRSQRGKDLVDWPPGERDAYVFTEINTVVNAFYLAALERMSHLALAIGKVQEAGDWQDRFQQTHWAFQQTLFDSEAGLYRDGPTTDHSSVHANLFPLAFGLVPDDRRQVIVDWLAARGMQCSVYGAQYLLEGLFNHGADRLAIELMTADNDRSWRHMLNSGTTITWEAWDQKYKPNQDWNHPWGAAPANLLPRFVLGVTPAEAGWKRASIRPLPGGLEFAKGKVPTPRGPILVDWNWDPARSFRIQITLPADTTATVDIPAPKNSSRVLVDGRIVQATRHADRWILTKDLQHSATIVAE